MDVLGFYHAALNADQPIRQFLREKVAEIETLERLDQLKGIELTHFGHSLSQPTDVERVVIGYRANTRQRYNPAQLLPYLNQQFGEGNIISAHNIAMGEYVGRSFQIAVANPKDGKYELPQIRLSLNVRTNKKIDVPNVPKLGKPIKKRPKR